jgi:hypothetical protein
VAFGQDEPLLLNCKSDFGILNKSQFPQFLCDLGHGLYRDAALSGDVSKRSRAIDRKDNVEQSFIALRILVDINVKAISGAEYLSLKSIDRYAISFEGINHP